MRGSSSRICVPKTFCHPRVMSRSLPHLTLTTSTSSLSLTSPILQSSSSTHPSLLSHDPWIHSDDSRRSCGSSDLPQVTSPKESSSTGNLEVEHQDHTRDRIMGDDYHSPIEIWMNLEKWVLSRCPTTSHWYTQLTIQQKALLTRTSKTNNYVKCWLHRCIFRSEKETLIFFRKHRVSGKPWFNGCSEERSKCTTDTSWSPKTRELDVKFISRAQSFRETWCNVFIWQWTNSKHIISKKPRQRTGRPVRELCSVCF